MAKLKAFKAYRPQEKLVEKVAELPYDVLNSEEAAVIAKGNEYSFFHVTKPEIDLSADIDVHDKEVYLQGKKKLNEFIEKQILIEEKTECLYLYTQVMNGKAQTGLVSCISIDDYLNNVIKKHEYTREDKEEDRSTHLDTLNANTGPVFLLFRQTEEKKNLLDSCMSVEPLYDFTAEDGVQHTVRVIDDSAIIKKITDSFANDTVYIADGHHRAASGANVGVKRREMNPGYKGDEEYNYFLSVSFPHDELNILAYNRAVKDLNGLDSESYLNKIKDKYAVDQNGKKIPESTEEFCMYLDGKWYTINPEFAISEDPIDSLDVKILQDTVLDPILGIGNPRTDDRISFIGGIRGTQELEKLVDSKDFAVAFSMYPTTVEQLMNVSDNDGIMPPKSTWFEPKLRSGLFVHSLD